MNKPLDPARRTSRGLPFFLSLLLFVSLSALALYLLLGSHAEGLSERSEQQARNSGHLLLFAALAISACNTAVLGFGPIKFFRLLAGTALLATAAGLLTEFLQGFVGRQPSVLDCLLDLIGALLGCTLYAAFAKRIRPGNILFVSNRQIHFIFIALVLASLVTLLPLWKALLDEHRTMQQFPILADYESKIEMGRHSGNSKTAWEPGSLLVYFSAGQLANIDWLYLARDWSAYRELAIELDNRASTALALACRIHDRAHENNYEHHDRYTRGFTLKPGRQTLLINLEAVRNAPQGRQMDMRKIASLVCFTRGLPQTRLLAFEQLRLQGMR
ncbi:MAG: VanZ family protein [Gammaproteobacteria bacterium]|nr:VanZ family protein [Gammaproteobacteria bacterium]RZV51612.1 MAG: hypothetical protein EX270_10260 [Pseudomonadales bacterium]